MNKIKTFLIFFLSLGVLCIILYYLIFNRTQSDLLNLRKAKVLWTHESGSTYFIKDNSIILESNSFPRVNCINKQNGKLQWKWEDSIGSGESFYLNLIDTVYIVYENKDLDTTYISAISEQTGESYWKKTIGEFLYSSNSSTESISLDTVLYIKGTNQLLAMNRFSGKIFYKKNIIDSIELKKKMDKSSNSYMFLGDGTRILDVNNAVMYNRNGNHGFTTMPYNIIKDTNYYYLSDTIYAINWRNNKVFWKKKGPETLNKRIIVGNKNIVFSYNNPLGCVEILDRSNGSLKWKKVFDSPVSPPYIKGQFLFIGDSKKNIYCYSLLEQSLLFTIEVPEDININNENFKANSNMLFYNGKNGLLYAIDIK